MASTSSMALHGNLFNACDITMQQISGQSNVKQLLKFYGFPVLPKTVDERLGDVEKLHALMSKHHKVVITGIVGLGKTTLATLCARKWVDDDTYQYAIFVNVETDKSASVVYERLAEIVLNSIKYSNNTVVEIHQYFNKYNTLLVLDNIEKNCEFQKFYPSQELKNICILGTSQFTELLGLFHPYPLQELSKEKSIKLVMDIFKNNNIEEHSAVVPVITDLVYELGYHPPALQHAAAHIVGMCFYSYMSLETSVNTYKKHFEIKLQEELPMDYLSEYRKPVYATLALNIEKATTGEEHIKSLLHCMTYLDPSCIDIKIFDVTFTENQIMLSRRQLKRYSLISVDGNMVSMHRLVAQVCHAMLAADDKIENLKILLDTMCYYTDNHWKFSIKHHCSFLIKHFEMYFKISKEKLAKYYIDAFHNNNQIQERLTARLQMINCGISDARGWSVQQCCVFAGHQTFYDYFNFTGNTTNCVDISEVGFVQVISNSSLNVFDFSILNFYKYNKERLNKAIFKGLTILSICAAFGIRDDDFIKLIDMGCDVNITDNNGITPILWATKNMSYKNMLYLHQHGATCDVIYKEVLTAAAAGDGELVLQLIRTCEVSYATGNYGKTLLWWAASNKHHDIVRELIKRGTDTSGADGRGNTLLHMVARRGYDKTIGQFIPAAVDINIANSDGDTALILAARNGHYKIVSELIGAEADLNIESRLGNTALISAAINGHDKIVAELIDERAELNIQNSDGYTAQMCAARNGHDKIVAKLIAADANIHIGSRLGNTARSLAAFTTHDGIVAQILNVQIDHNIETRLSNISLISAAARGDVITVIRLIGAKVDPNIVDSDGNTALMLAAKHGHDKTVSDLISAKADLNIANSQGDTALIFAAMYGHDKIVAKLVDSNADVHIVGSDGHTALQLAAMYGHDKITTQLVQAGANVNIADSRSRTPLYWAAVRGYREIVTKLVNRGARVNTANKYGSTPLLVAAEGKYREISMYLIKQGASVNAVDRWGNTPLLFAAKHGYYELALELIRRRARTDTPANYRGETPLSWARRNGDDRMCALLQVNEEE